MRLDPAGSLLPKRSRRAARARTVLAAASGLAVLGAAGAAQPPAAAAASSSTITIAAVPGVDNAPIYLAKKEGLFAAAGLKNVVIKTYSSQAAELSALQSAQADIAASDYGTIFYQQSQSARSADPWRWLRRRRGRPRDPDPAQFADQVAARPRGPDDRAPRGQRAAEPARSSSPISLDAAAATQVLHKLSREQRRVGATGRRCRRRRDQRPRAAPLKAILVSEPYIYQAESQLGAVEVLDACSGSTPTCRCRLRGDERLGQGQPGRGGRLPAGAGQGPGRRAMTGHVQQLLPSTTGMTAQDADLITIGSYPTSTSVVSLERVVRLLSNKLSTSSPQRIPAVPPMIVHG